MTWDTNSIRFFDSKTSRLLVTLPEKQVRDLSFTPDGTRLILIQEDNSLRILDPRPYEVRQRERDERYEALNAMESFADELWKLDLEQDDVKNTVERDTSKSFLQRAVLLDLRMRKKQDFEETVRTKTKAIQQESISEEEFKKGIDALEMRERRLALKLSGWIERSSVDLERIAWGIVIRSNLTSVDYDRALKASEMARRLKSTEDRRRDNLVVLGAALFRCGELDRAIVELEQTRELLRRTGKIDFFAETFLAMALFREDRTDEARKALERAIEVHDKEDDEEVQLLEEANGLLSGEVKR